MMCLPLPCPADEAFIGGLQQLLGGEEPRTDRHFRAAPDKLKECQLQYSIMFGETQGCLTVQPVSETNI